MNAMEADITSSQQSDMSDEQQRELNEKTRVPLGIAVAAVCAFIGGALWLNNSLNRIDQRLAQMERSMSDRWTGSDMRIWALQLRLDNASLKVPEPDNKR